jgi:hypothetical protein
MAAMSASHIKRFKQNYAIQHEFVFPAEDRNVPAIQCHAPPPREKVP